MLVSCGNDPAAPRARVSPLEVDLGEVEEGAEIPVLFSVRNEGGAPLRLGRAMFHCACLVSQEELLDIAPGGTAELRLTFTALKLRNPVLEGITIPSNDPEQGRISLTIRARIVPRLLIDPETVDVGALREGDVVEREVRIRNARSGPLGIGSISSSDPAVTAQVADSGVEGVHLIRVRAHGDRHARGLMTRLALAIEREGRTIEQVIYVTGKIVSIFELAPPVVYFGQFDAQAPPESVIDVVSNGSGTSEITGAQNRGDRHVEAVLEVVEPGVRYRLKLRPAVSLPPGKFFGEVLMSVQGREEPLGLPYSGYVRTKP